MENIGWFVGGIFIGGGIFMTVILPMTLGRFITENTGKTLKQTVGEKTYELEIREI